VVNTYNKTLMDGCVVVKELLYNYGVGTF